MTIKLNDFQHQYSADRSTLKFEQSVNCHQNYGYVLVTEQGQVLSTLQMTYYRHTDTDGYDEYYSFCLTTNFQKELMEESDRQFVNLTGNTSEQPYFTNQRDFSKDATDSITNYSPIGFLALTNLNNRYILIDHTLSKQGQQSVKNCDDTNHLPSFNRALLAVKPLIFEIDGIFMSDPQIDFMRQTLTLKRYYGVKQTILTHQPTVTYYLKYRTMGMFTLHDADVLSTLVNHDIFTQGRLKFIHRHVNEKLNQFLESKLVFQPNIIHGGQQITTLHQQQALNVDQLLALQNCEVI